MREHWEKSGSHNPHDKCVYRFAAAERIRDKSLRWELMEAAEGQNETEICRRAANEIKMANNVDFESQNRKKL